MTPLKELVLSTVVKLLKNAWKDSEIAAPDLLELLYDAVAQPSNLLNKAQDTITVSKSQASKIMNRKNGGNPLKIIRDHSGDPSVLDNIEDYFQRNIVSRLLPGSEEDLAHHFTLVIQADPLISPAKRKELTFLAQKETLAIFLAKVYLYSLTRDNVLAEQARNPQQLEKIPVPQTVAATEFVYAKALLDTYGQAEGQENFTHEMLTQNPKHHKHFNEQRAYYYAAVALHRGTRDIYDENNQFEILIDETYEGVKETWEEPYKDGLTRLRRVMTQASATRVDRCRLAKETDWIGNSQKKGICHFLVNQNRLKGWVREDDEIFQ